MRIRIFQITAREDLTNPQLSGNTTVVINVLDVNDMDPQFSAQDKNVSIFEDAPGGTVVIDLDVSSSQGLAPNRTNY